MTRSIEDAENRIKAARQELADAEEALRTTRNALLSSISTGNCIECGALIMLGQLPSTKGRQVNSIGCDGCSRRYDVLIDYNGEDRYAPASYHIEMIFRGYLTDTLPADRLTNAQLDQEKHWLMELGEAAVPAQKERLNQLLMCQLLRTDAAKLDDIQATNKSILDLLRAKLGGGA